MRPSRPILINVTTMVSVLLLAATAVCWVTGAVREKHATVWRLRSRPERTFFVRIDRQHLIFSNQQMAPVRVPAEYTVDFTRFQEFRVTGPIFPHVARTELRLDHFALNPSGAWFRKIHAPAGGILIPDKRGGVALQVKCFYGAVEIPWWSLFLLFSLWPASRWVVRYRRRAKVGRGLCSTCGYDLRATPDRCPECGIPQTLATGSN